MYIYSSGLKREKQIQNNIQEGADAQIASLLTSGAKLHRNLLSGLLRVSKARAFGGKHVLGVARYESAGAK